MFGGLRKILKGAVDQVNPFDGGKTFKNPQGQPQPVQTQPLLPQSRTMPYGMKDMSTADSGIVGPTSSFPPVGPAQPIQYEDGSNSAGQRAMDSYDDFMPQLLRTLFRR